MPDVEFSTDDASEDLPEPRPRSNSRLGIALVVVAVAVTIAAVLIRGQHDSHSTAATTAAPTPTLIRPVPSAVPSSSTPSPATLAGAGGSDVLDYTGVFSVSGSLGSADITYVFDLVNESTKAVTIAYPIRLVGPGNVVIAPVFAGMYDQATATSHMNGSAAPAHRLKRIGAGVPESLLIRIHIDCDAFAGTGQSRADEAAIRIDLVGFARPALFTFLNLASGFDDVVRQVCGG